MYITYDYQIFSSQRYGGISRYFIEIIRRIGRMPNSRVALVAGSYLSAYDLEGLSAYVETFRGWRRPDALQLPKTNRAFSAFNRIVARQHSRHWTADIYHQTYFQDPFRPAGARTVLTVYDLIPELYSKGSRTENRLLAQRRKAIQAADKLICISQCTKHDLIERLDVPEAKVAVISLANSLHLPSAHDSLIDEPYILYVGQRAGYKNFDALLAAFAQEPELNRSFKLVCFGGSPFSRSEEERMARFRIRERVQHVQGADLTLATLYRHATAFVYPSLYEGFGLPPLEAMYYGCPVLVNSSGSLPEVVGHAALFCDASSIEDLRDKLKQITRDRALRERLIPLGYEQERTFSWDRSACETFELYRDLCGCG